MDSEILDLDGWTLRARKASVPGSPVLILLHGWLGNEDVMWIFTSKVPENFTVFSPRALHPAPDGGYSWVQSRTTGYSTFADFEPSVRALDGLIDSLQSRIDGDFTRIHVMGFSQGAALAYSWAARSPQRIRSLAVLAGFLPEGTGAHLAEGAWAGMPVFIAHGTQDETVPIEMMRAGAGLVESTGADLTVCEDETGHKLSADCLRALGGFYKSLPP